MQFLIEYSYLVLFLVIFLDQVGLPIPSLPVVLGAGTLAGLGEMNVYLATLVSVLACIPADYFWYHLGRSRGGKVLTLLCGISLEPDYCVERTEVSFERLGPLSLVVSKFVPGLQTIAPPMAGLTRMPASQFLLLNTLGTVIWAITFIALGYFFSDTLNEWLSQFAELGTVAVALAVSGLLLFVLVKLLQKRFFMRSLRMRMLEPSELHEKLSAGESPYIIDLRHRLDFVDAPFILPGALRIPLENIDSHHELIPRDRDIVLYCS